MRRAIEVLTFLLWPTLAWANQPVEVDWNAPPQCPARSVLVDRIEALLGRSLEDPFERALKITATATITNGASVRIVSNDGGQVRERELDGADCGELVEATALVIAIAIDPAAIAWSPPETSKPPSTAPPPDVRTTRTGTTAIPDRPPPPSDELRAPDIPFGISVPRLDFRAGLRGGAGVVPEAGLGIGFGGAVLWSPLRFQAAGSFWLSRNTPRPGSQAEASLIAVDGDICYVIDALAGTLEFPFCGGLEVGRFAVDPIDPIFSSFRALWAGGTLGSGVGLNLGRHVAILLEIEGVLSFTRPNYSFPSGSGITEPVRTGRLGARAGLWVELRVP